jgi:hypothetical protein
LPRSNKPQISTIVRPLTTSLEQQKSRGAPGLSKKSKTTFREARGSTSGNLNERSSNAEVDSEQQQQTDQHEEQELTEEELAAAAIAQLTESQVLLGDDENERVETGSEGDDILNDDKYDTDIEKEGTLFFALLIKMYCLLIEKSSRFTLFLEQSQQGLICIFVFLFANATTRLDRYFII